MASRRFEGRPVDLGAAFFTADLEGPFGVAAKSWLDRGLARPWTDTLSVSEPGRALVTKTGPMRYAAPGGLRSLLTDLAEGLDIELEHPFASVSDAGREHSTVVLAMPDPQARRLLPAGSATADRLSEGFDWAPTIAVALGWTERESPADGQPEHGRPGARQLGPRRPEPRRPERPWAADFHGAFINGSPVLSFLADDGDRRGDAAPVLVAHSSAELAREHLENPDAAIPPITEAALALLEFGDAPSWSHAHRWTFARPLAQHPEPYLLEDGIGVCGDAWGASSSVGTAWTSGDALGRAIAAQLG